MCLTSISEPSMAERQEAGTAGWNWTLRERAEIVMSWERRVVSKDLQERRRTVFRLPNNSLPDGLGYLSAKKKEKKKKTRSQSDTACGKVMKLWIMDSKGVFTLACYAAFPWALLTSANWNAEHLSGPAEICTAFQDPSSICAQLQSLDSHVK